MGFRVFDSKLQTLNSLPAGRQANLLLLFNEIDHLADGSIKTHQNGPGNDAVSDV